MLFYGAKTGILAGLRGASRGITLLGYEVGSEDMLVGLAMTIKLMP